MVHSQGINEPSLGDGEGMPSSIADLQSRFRYQEHI